MTLPSAKKLELWAAMDSVWAAECLRERGGELGPEELRALVLASCGDKTRADRAAAERDLQLRRAQDQAARGH